MMSEEIPGRDLAALVVPRWGRLVETSDRNEPYRLVDSDGETIEAVTVYFRELLAAGKSTLTVRSYGMDLLRWWRFLHTEGIPWDRATRADASDFSCWIQLTAKRRQGGVAGTQPGRGSAGWKGR